MLGVSGCSGGVRGVFGAGRECRYSGASRGIGSKRGQWGLLGEVGGVRGYKGGISGVGGVRVYWGTGRKCRYSGARRGIGSIRGIGGLDVGVWGH